MPDAPAPSDDATPAGRLLLVDDSPLYRKVLLHTLRDRNYELLTAGCGEEAIEIVRAERPDLVLLDVMMPGIDGFETCTRLKADPETRDVAVIFMSGRDEASDKVRGLGVGAVDYVTKPFDPNEVIARVDTHLRVRRLERSLAEANASLLDANRRLEEKVQDRTREVLRSRDAVIFGLAKLAESRDDDTGKHLDRISRYVELLAQRVAPDGADPDGTWIRTVTTTAALHDIGKVGIPDAVLLKPGKLTDEERRIMQRHTTIGGDTLLAIKQRWQEDGFLVMATQIAFGHHERWDGTGYPFRLAGDTIPLAARLVAVADVYDALTSRRVYKPPMPHEKARGLIVEASGTQFDPLIVEAFKAAEELFRQIAAELGDGGG